MGVDGFRQQVGDGQQWSADGPVGDSGVYYFPMRTSMVYQRDKEVVRLIVRDRWEKGKMKKKQSVIKADFAQQKHKD
ncbi:hypothetical protein L2E82_02851 [Cichorium intybus]|uniref:Uncharacterized protein n=1 Tax=Cichorium intybus TaxID=13427 RepID=A0ACB9H2X5_CICIN|nr:hypothetical protein L2E82_02851 [Cichorium intybus]